jgi:hypothetical protein
MKIKKLVLLAMCILFSILLHTQTFEKYIKTKFDDIVYNAVEIDDNHVVFVLNSGSYSDQIYDAKIYKLNTFSGEFVDSVDVVCSNPDYYQESIDYVAKLGDTAFIIIGNVKDIAITDRQMFIGIYDFQLNCIFDTVVGDPNIIVTFFNHIIDNNILLSVGARGPGISQQTLLYITDIFGNFIAERIFNHEGWVITSIVQPEGSDFYHLYQYWSTYHSFYVLNKNTLETDTIIEYPLGYLPRDAMNAPDAGEYYVAGRQYDTEYPPQLGSFLSYLKVSDNGQAIQQFNFEMDNEVTYYTYQSFDYNSSNIYFGGGYPCTWDPSLLFYPEERYILLNKISHDGELIWQNFYKGDVNYMPFKILATNDGGALIFSTRYDWNDPIPNQRDVHILKIDSTGYYSPITGTEEVVEQPRQVLVYPNPVKDKLHFVFGLYSNLTISIYDASGREMISETYHRSPTLDLSGFKKGLYLYRITGARGLIENGKIIKE